MNNFKKYLIFLVLFIVGISYFNTVKATVILQQPISSTSTNAGYSAGTQTIGNSFGTINSGIINIKKTSTLNLDIYIDAVSSTGYFFPVSFGSTSVSALNNFEFANFTLTPSISSSASSTATDYQIRLRSTESGGTYEVRGSANSNSYSNGQWFGGTETVKDIYFKLGTDLSISNLSITYPTNNSVVPSFNLWQVEYSINATTTGDINLYIDYGTSTNFGFSDALTLYGTESASDPVFSGSGTTSILKNITTLLPGDYYARPRAEIRPWTGSKYTIQTGSTIFFSLTEISNPYFGEEATNTFGGGIFGFSTTTGGIFGQCEQLNVNFWQSAVCNLLTFLFQPHEIVFEKFKQVLISFKKVFPFNVAFDLQESTSNAYNIGIATTSRSAHITQTIHTATIDTDLFKSTWWTDMNLTNVRDLYFSVMSMIIWIATGIGMVKMIL